MSKTFSKALPLVLAIALMFVVGLNVSANHDPFGGVPQSSVEICHATGSGYISNSPNVSATGDLNGHGAQHEDDIIPPFHYLDKDGVDQSSSGRNWNDSNEDIWASGNCDGDGVVNPTAGTLTINKVISGETQSTADDFSFQINGGSSTAFEADGSNAVVLTLTDGPFSVTEVSPGAGFTVSYSGCSNVSLTAQGATCTITNTVVVGPIDHCPAVDGFQADGPCLDYTCDQQGGTWDEENQECDMPHDPTAGTIIATKIVCDSETDLPNWGGGGADITSTTATDFIASHPQCHLEPNWNFEVKYWGPEQANEFENENDIPFVAIPGSTNASGVLTTTFNVDDVWHFWIREVEKSGYIPFDGSGVSAEMYCASDVLNYDNLEQVDGPFTAGSTFYCVAWNVPTPNSCEANLTDQTLVSDDTTTDGNGNASELTFIHPGWTASIPGATWIWEVDGVNNPTTNETVTFTKTFNVSGTPTIGTLDIAADNSYKVWVNGTLVANVADENNFELATQDNYNVLSLLQNGSNTLTIEATNVGVAESTAQSNPAGLLYKLSVTNNACVPDGGGSGDDGVDLRIEKNVNDDEVDQGDAVTFTITVTNDGPDTATGVVVNDLLPSDLAYVSHNTATGTYVPGTGVWTVGTLTDGQSATLTIVAEANGDEGETLVNTATVDHVDDDNSSNDSDTASVTVNEKDNGGGGGGNNSSHSSGSSRRSGGSVLGAQDSNLPPTPQVLGAAVGLPYTGTSSGMNIMLLVLSGTLMLLGIGSLVGKRA